MVFMKAFPALRADVPEPRLKRPRRPSACLAGLAALLLAADGAAGLAAAQWGDFGANRGRQVQAQKKNGEAKQNGGPLVPIPERRPSLCFLKPHLSTCEGNPRETLFAGQEVVMAAVTFP